MYFLVIKDKNFTNYHYIDEGIHFFLIPLTQCYFFVADYILITDTQHCCQVPNGLSAIFGEKILQNGKQF
jgi:hypothetical protein